MTMTVVPCKRNYIDRNIRSCLKKTITAIKHLLFLNYVKDLPGSCFVATFNMHSDCAFAKSRFFCEAYGVELLLLEQDEGSFLITG